MKKAPIAASINHLDVFYSETDVSLSLGMVRIEDFEKSAAVTPNSGVESNTTNSNSPGLPHVRFNEIEPMEVVDDWEKDYE